MYLRLLCLSLIAPLHGDQIAEQKDRSPISLLPNGSVLKDVLLPRYDDRRGLAGSLKAKTLTLIDEKHVEGTDVTIDFYDEKQKKTGNVYLTKALFDQESFQLYADEPVRVKNDGLTAEGSGLVYGFRSGKGFLRGPANTQIAQGKDRRTSQAGPVFGLLFPAIFIAAPPAFVGADELAEIEKDANSRADELTDRGKATAAFLKAQEVKNAELGEAANQFIEMSALTFISKGKEEELEAPRPEDREMSPLEVPLDPANTLIKCKKGMYFDSEEGVLVYMGAVELSDPRFLLSGADEVKIFFAKDTDVDGEKSQGMGGSFGEVDRLVATGVVKILQKAANGKEPIEASGKVLTYDIGSGDIIVSGGYPWVKQGTFYARAKEANLTLRMKADNSFATQGNWEMGGRLNMNR